MNLDALIKKAKGQGQKKPAKKQPKKKNTGTAGKKVSFVTKDGAVVQFTPKKKAPGQKRAASAYNKYVGRRIRQLVAKGYTNPNAMKQAAKEWRQGKR